MHSRVNYISPTSRRPRYHVNDGSRDILDLEPRTVPIEDARSAAQSPSLAREGFALFRHRSAVSDFRDAQEISAVYPSEIENLLLDLTSADRIVCSAPGVRRFAHHSPNTARLTNSGRLYNTHPVHFVHVDINSATAAGMAKRLQRKEDERPVRRFAHYNLWRVISPPPQDIPLALCDSRSVSPSDMVDADAMMDIPGKTESSYESLLLRHNPRHRWAWFPDMRQDEVVVFKAYDSDTSQPRAVPHSAFANSMAGPAAVARSSIEMRAVAFWFEA